MKANGVECIDCPGFGNYYEGVEECPEDPEHGVAPVFISETPLGRADDQDARVNKRDTSRSYSLWVYEAEY